MPERDEESFLSRWSRRKQEARLRPLPEDRAPPQAPATTTRPPGDDDDGGAIASQGHPPTAAPAGDEPPRMLTEADFADVDFDLLDAGSDYKRFMASNVPDSIRTRALAKLWTSDPQFAGLDPWHDYHVDFTDAARAVPTGLATAYRVGRGFLNDEEVAAWENLGKPVPAKAPADDAAPGAQVASAAAGPADAPSNVAVPSESAAPVAESPSEMAGDTDASRQLAAAPAAAEPPPPGTRKTGA